MRSQVVCCFLLFFVFAKALDEDFGLDGHSLENKEFNQTDNRRGTELVVFKTHGTKTDVSLNRKKKGWGSVLVYGASILTRGGSLGFSLAQAISDGCAAFPSICRDKAEIERLDVLIRRMKTQYDQEYIENKKEFLELRIASTDNGYISYYINETIRAVETIEEVQEIISDTLEVELPELFKMFEASKNGLTANEYLESLIGKLEFNLASIKQTIEGTKRGQLITIAASFLIEAAVNKFVKTYSKAYSQVRQIDTEDVFASSALSKLFTADANEAAIMLDPNHPRHNEVMQENGLTEGSGKKFKLTRTCKYAFKALKQMGKNLWSKLKGIQTGIKKWQRIKSWKGFVGKLKHTLKGPLQKLKNIKNFFTKSGSRKYFVNKFKLGWSGGIMTAIGFISDAVSIAIATKDWKQLADRLKESRIQYKEYHDNLNAQLQSIKKEKEEMHAMWSEIIDTFKNLSISFKDLVDNATKNANFSVVVGLPKIPVDITSPLFKIKLDQTNRASIRPNQGAVIEFLKSVDNEMTQVVDEMRARQILYDHVLTMTEHNEPVKDILDKTKTVYKYSPSATVRGFGEQLSTKDIVCTISQIRETRTEYDFFPLKPFNPRCDVNSTIFMKYEQEASLLRNEELMSKVIGNYKGSSLSSLMDRVKGAYLVHNDPDLRVFGNSITEQDVICVVSKEFPKMEMFDFFSLKSFRPDCSAVTAANFRSMKSDTELMRRLAPKISTTMKTCTMYKFCPCPSLMATMNGISEDDLAVVLTIIKSLNPGMTEYCGTTGCACVVL